MFEQPVVIAASIAVISFIVVTFARVIGRWLMKAITRTFADTVLTAMGPELDKLGVQVAEAQVINTEEHTKTSTRLGAVENRLTDVEQRLSAVENLLEQP